MLMPMTIVVLVIYHVRFYLVGLFHTHTHASSYT